jgi:sulfonate transport system substrate-binding protein
LLPDVKTYDHAFYVARSDVAVKYPQLFAKFVKIIRETQAYIFAHPAESVVLWASQGGFPPNGTEQAVHEKLVRDARLSESTAVALKPIDEAAAASTQDLADNFHALGVLPMSDRSCWARSSTPRRRPSRWSSVPKQRQPGQQHGEV